MASWFQEYCVCPGGRKEATGAQVPAKPPGAGAEEPPAAAFPAPPAAAPNVVRGRSWYARSCHCNSCVAVAPCNFAMAPMGPAGAFPAAAGAAASAPPLSFLPPASAPFCFGSLGAAGATYIGSTAPAPAFAESSSSMASTLSWPFPAHSEATSVEKPAAISTRRAATSLAMPSSKGARVCEDVAGDLLPAREASHSTYAFKFSKMCRDSAASATGPTPAQAASASRSTKTPSAIAGTSDGKSVLPTECQQIQSRFRASTSLPAGIAALISSKLGMPPLFDFFGRAFATAAAPALIASSCFWSAFPRVSTSAPAELPAMSPPAAFTASAKAFRKASSFRRPSHSESDAVSADANLAAGAGTSPLSACATAVRAAGPAEGINRR
mmetsp:Transcript_72212/g.202678  ORF Transcript_72212/g.202678 Transcript_72212/m.202678 type:complete len:383 (+) Transcript_72212:197-1345(+)